MTKVEVRNGNLEQAMSVFKNSLAKNNIPSEVKKRQHAVKPGEQKRAAKEAGIKKAQKANKKSSGYRNFSSSYKKPSNNTAPRPAQANTSDKTEKDGK